ncbi:MAG: inositol monophosphatase family protein [Jatrophihabitantaceae bacterium]
MTLTDARLAADLAVRAGELLLGLQSASGLIGKELGARGDANSNALLLEQLAAHRPDDAVLSEESVDTAARLTADRVWIIDPLDGTREYGIPGRPDWAVHVALWQRGRGITDAAVSQPALAAVYASDDARAPEVSEPVVLVSDSRPPTFSDAVAAAIGARVVAMGSAGAKAMAVLRGDASAYVHAGGQWEWDSAAPVGVVLAAGLHASRIDGSPLVYNEAHPYLPDLIICRPELADAIVAAIAPPDFSGMSFTHTESLVVDASCDSLYDLVTDIARTGEWSPICRKCWWRDGDGPRVGAWFIGHNEADGRVWETESQVAVAESGREFAWLVGGKFVRWSFQFEAGPHGTRVTESWEFLPEGRAMFHAKYGAQADVQIEMRRSQAHAGIPATLAAIKAIAEREKRL